VLERADEFVHLRSGLAPVDPRGRAGALLIELFREIPEPGAVAIAAHVDRRLGSQDWFDVEAVAAAARPDRLRCAGVAVRPACDGHCTCQHHGRHLPKRRHCRPPSMT
jgi:hypothetical protein